METVLMYGVGGSAMVGIAAYYLYLIWRGLQRIFFFLLLRKGQVQTGLLFLQESAEVFKEMGKPPWSNRG